MTNSLIVSIDNDGITLNERQFCKACDLSEFVLVIGQPSRTIEAGLPAPFGHRNNQVHIFDRLGIYLTEHHSTRLVGSVNLIFEADESPFPIDQPFSGDLFLFGNPIRTGMTEGMLDTLNLPPFQRDLPGEFSYRKGMCWIGVSTMRKRGRDRKRRGPQVLDCVSVCFR